MRYVVIMLALLISVNTCQAITNEEQQQLKVVLELQCEDYGRACEVLFLDTTNIVNAFTAMNGRIYFTKGILDKLTYKELLGVGYHEVGHHILEHLPQSYDFYQIKRTPEEIKRFRWQKEIEADVFALVVSLKRNEPCYLEQALTSLVQNKQLQTFEDNTHPSVLKRITLLQQIQYTTTYNKGGNFEQIFNSIYSYLNSSY